MDKNQTEKSELLRFLSEEGESFENAPLPAGIVKDLVRSKTELAILYGVGSLLGYILSLIICAQCAIGLSPLSWVTASWIHSIPDPWCPLLCGAIFGISPTLVSLFYFNRFQHRYLLFHIPWLPFSMPLLGSLLLIFSGDSHSWSWRGFWLFSALATPYIVELLSAYLLKQNRWQE